MQTPSLGGLYYFLTFIDDFNRKFGFTFSSKNQKPLVGFKSSKLKQRSTVGDILKFSDLMMEVSMNLKHSLNYVSRMELKKKVTKRYTPQSNGVAE